METEQSKISTGSSDGSPAFLRPPLESTTDVYEEAARLYLGSTAATQYSPPKTTVSDDENRFQTVKNFFLGISGPAALSVEASLNDQAIQGHIICGSPTFANSLKALQRYLPSNTTVSDADHLDAFSCDHFRMYEFKVRSCARARSHDWTECPYAHPGEKARRRDPRKYHYSGTACPDFRKGACKKGGACEFAHGVLECWLHPARYRTQPCQDGTQCRRRVCFFAHAPDELRVVSQTASYDGSPGRLSMSMNKVSYWQKPGFWEPHIDFSGVIIKSERPKPRNLPCPRCSSTNTDFCNFVDDDLSRHLCKHCHSHWTNRDTPRDAPVGGGFLESYFPSFNNRVRTTPATSTPTTAATASSSSSGGNNNIAHEIPYANPPSMVPQKGSGSSFNERVRKTPATSTLTAAAAAAAAASSSSSGGNNNIAHEFPHANPASMVPQMDSGSRPHDGFLNGLRNEAVPEAPDIRSSQIEVIPPAERDLSEQVDSQNFAFASSSDHGRPPMGPASDGDYLIIEIGEQNMPPVSLPDENRFQTANNNTILGITGQAAISLVFANQPVSTVARCFAAANGFGFLGSFLGNYAQKKPELAKILYKIGAIGAASAVIVSLGTLLPEDTPWKLNVVATAASCLGVAYVVSTS